MTEKIYVGSRAQRFFLNANGIVNDGAKGNSIKESEVITTKAFIKSCCRKLRNKSTKNSSYGFKHMAEKWGEEINEIIGKEIFSNYVSNGAFIRGAKEMGFTVYKIGKTCNCEFNMSANN